MCNLLTAHQGIEQHTLEVYTVCVCVCVCVYVCVCVVYVCVCVCVCVCVYKCNIG